MTEVKIEKIDLQNTKLDPEIYYWCRRTNFYSMRKADGEDSNGLMRDLIEDCRDNKNGIVYLALINGRKVGWGIAEPYRVCKIKWQFQCYVLPTFRNKGIGSKLIKTVVADLGAISVLPFDKKSRAFFIKNGMTRGKTIKLKE